MQTADNGTFSLRAIDGRLAGLGIDARHAPSDAAIATARAIGRLLRDAGAGIQCRETAVDTAGAAITLEAPQRLDVPGDGVSIARIRSFYPVIRTRLPKLDLAIVWAEGAGIDRPLEVACRFARRFERREVQVVSTAQDATAAAIDRRLDAWRNRFPDLDFEVVPVAELIGSFAAGRGNSELVVAPALCADILREVAGILSGAAALATVTRFEAGTMRLEPMDIAHIEPGEPRGSALILGAADLLVWLGRAGASGRIINAWARTLEHGSHTDEFNVLSPYSKRLDVEDFAAVLANRLDERPRTLELQQPGCNDVDPQHGARHLRLVSSRP